MFKVGLGSPLLIPLRSPTLNCLGLSGQGAWQTGVTAQPTHPPPQPHPVFQILFNHPASGPQPHYLKKNGFENVNSLMLWTSPAGTLHSFWEGARFVEVGPRVRGSSVRQKGIYSPDESNSTRHSRDLMMGGKRGPWVIRPNFRGDSRRDGCCLVS